LHCVKHVARRQERCPALKELRQRPQQRVSD
jgi:hypothetical protein